MAHQVTENHGQGQQADGVLLELVALVHQETFQGIDRLDHADHADDFIEVPDRRGDDHDLGIILLRVVLVAEAGAGAVLAFQGQADIAPVGKVLAVCSPVES